MREIKAILQIVILLCSMFTVSLLNVSSVSALEPGDGCCELTNDGEYCVDTSSDSCTDSNYQIGTTCSQSNFCALGCCWDPSTGEYGKNTPKATCEADGGLFDGTNPSCENIPALEEGCCQLPSGCSYVTRAACRAAITDLTELNLDDVFRTDIEGEYECTDLCRSADVGCFVPEDLSLNSCTFGFRSEFLDLNGEFRGDVYCSNVPECDATEKHSKGCLTPQQSQYFGDDDNVHWFDSLGNPEQVVGTVYTGYVDDVRYGNNCNPDSDNTDSSDCGYCDSVGFSNICGEVDTGVDLDYQCVSLNCGDGYEDIFKWVKSNDFETGWEYDEEGNDNFVIKNSDSWCYYEGVVGEGRDLVGSMHQLFRCKDGEIIHEVDNSGGRDNVCYMSFDENDRPSAKFFPNNALGCLQANDPELDCSSDCNYDDDLEQAICCRMDRCGEIPESCYWNEAVDLCAPITPPSTLLSDVEGEDSACQTGSFALFYSCLKDWGSWDCDPVFHDYKKDESYMPGYNSFCRSVGDCGVWYNLEGELGEGGYKYVKSKYSGDDATTALGRLGKLNPPNSLTEHFFTYLNGDLSEAFALWQELVSVFSGRTGAISDHDRERHGTYQYILGGLGIWSSLVSVYHAGAYLVSGGGANVGSYLLSFFSFGTLGGGGEAAGALAAEEGAGLVAGESAGGLGVIGTVAIVVVVAVVIAVAINYFTSEQGIVQVEFQCLPWNPPENVPESVCMGCANEDDPYDTCTEYECTSLGANCEFKGENPDGSIADVGTCFSLEKELIPPVITPLEIYDDKTYQPIAEGGYRVQEKFGYDEPIVVGVETNEKAACVISKVRDLEYDEMVLFDNEKWQTEHEVELSITNSDPGLDSLSIYGDGEKIYYVSCKDVFGNLKENYKITFTMDETPDVEPPRIVKFDPVNNGFIRYNAENTNVYLLVQDRSGVDSCRYSLQSNMEFDDMESLLICRSELTRDAEGLSGYECRGKIENLQNNFDNKYYIKCQDSLGRANSQDTTYTLKGTVPLIITNYGPSDTIYSREITLEATTDSGAEAGDAICKYIVSEEDIDQDYIYEGMFEFSETGTRTHGHSLTLINGDYNALIKCRDAAGNEDSAYTSFTVDTPELFITDLLPENNSRIYTNSFELYVKTEGGIDSNGDSTCYYSFNDQPMGIIPDKDVMQSYTTHIHNLSLSDGEYDFNILCEDSAGKQVEEFIHLTLEQGAYPRLRAVYTQSGQLYVMVDQPSECSYATESFTNFEDGTAMVRNSDYIHVLNIGSFNTFYIMCRDTRTNNLSPIYTINV